MENKNPEKEAIEVTMLIIIFMRDIIQIINVNIITKNIILIMNMRIHRT